MPRASSSNENREPELRNEDILKIFRTSRQLTDEQFANLNDIRLVNDKFADYVDPPSRLSGGRGQIHHQHFKCLVIYQVDGVEKRDLFYLDHRTLWLLSEFDGEERVVSRERLPLLMSQEVARGALPASSYFEDDVQYFPPGPQFQLNQDTPTSESRGR